MWYRFVSEGSRPTGEVGGGANSNTHHAGHRRLEINVGIGERCRWRPGDGVLGVVAVQRRRLHAARRFFLLHVAQTCARHGGKETYDERG